MARKPYLALLIFVAMLLVAVPLAVSGCGGGSSVSLTYTYKAGDTWTHEVDTLVQGTIEGLGSTSPGESSQETKSKITSTVKSVSADGVATVEVTTQIVELTVNGLTQDTSGQAPQVVTITLDKSGKILSTQADEGTGSSFMQSGNFLNPNDLGSQLRTLIFPASGKAEVGDEWTSTSSIPLTGLGKELTMTTKAKLVGVATENGRQVASIEYSTQVPMDLDLDLGPLFAAMMSGLGGDTSTTELVLTIVMKGSVQFSGTTKVDLSTGQTASSDATGNMSVSLQVEEAPEEIVPKDQRGPFKTNATLTMEVTEVE